MYIHSTIRGTICGTILYIYIYTCHISHIIYTKYGTIYGPMVLCMMQHMNMVPCGTTWSIHTIHHTLQEYVLLGITLLIFPTGGTLNSFLLTHTKTLVSSLTYYTSYVRNASSVSYALTTPFVTSLNSSYVVEPKSSYAFFLLYSYNSPTCYNNKY